MSEILTDRPSAKAGPRWFNYRVKLSDLVSEAFEFVERRRASMPRQIARWAAAGRSTRSTEWPFPRGARRLVVQPRHEHSASPPRHCGIPARH